jgi:protein lifeguard
MRLLPAGELLLNASMIGSLVSLLVLIPCRLRFPLNVCLLGVFTVCEALMLGVATLTVPASLLGKAALLTLAMFFSLTAYARQGTQDYQFVRAFACNLLFLLLAGSLSALFAPAASLLHDLLLVLAVLLCGAVILFDTWRIMHRFRANEHVLAALELYLDLVNLFLYIVRALSRRRN